jgi:hypothetical protein
LRQWRWLLNRQIDYLNPDRAHDRRNPMTIRVHDDDPGAFGDLLGRVPIGKQMPQLSACFPRQDNSNLFVFHPETESHSHPGFKCQ